MSSPVAPLDRPRALVRDLFRRYANPSCEVLGAVFLDASGRWLGDREIHRSELTAIEPAQVLKPAMELKAKKLLLFHTHLNGDPEPSEYDFHFTYEIDFAAEAFGLELVDHWVLGSAERWESIKGEGGETES